jgi:toxoflavin synthase
MVGLSKISTPIHALNKVLQSPIELVEGILRKDNLEVFELWLESGGTRSSQYDKIAERFRQIRNSPVNKHIVDHTFFEMVGGLVRKKSVLDLACGEGHYCRVLKRRGAARVVGVDISSQMIKLAEQQEAGEPLGIDYICRDVLKLGRIGDYDLVVASFLLNYAQTREQLVRMCRTVFENLKPGGHFILLNENFNQSPRDFYGYERYGYAKSMAQPYREGAVITYKMSTGTEELEFKGYYWTKETYQMAFDTAGFKDVQLLNLSCSPQGIEEYGHRFWQNFINNPPFVGIICRK